MSVPFENFEAIAREAGLPMEKQAAYHKISVGGRAIYVADTKKVSRIDLSGFNFQHPAVIRLNEEQAKALKVGKVRGQIDFSRTEELVLEAFRTAIAVMKHAAGMTARELGKFNRYIKPVESSIELLPLRATPPPVEEKKSEAAKPTRRRGGHDNHAASA